VLLGFCHGGKPFLARRALISGFSFPVSSETGNFVSVISGVILCSSSC
jgi:hypothetical protein